MVTRGYCRVLWYVNRWRKRLMLQLFRWYSPLRNLIEFVVKDFISPPPEYCKVRHLWDGTTEEVLAKYQIIKGFIGYETRSNRNCLFLIQQLREGFVRRFNKCRKYKPGIQDIQRVNLFSCLYIKV